MDTGQLLSAVARLLDIWILNILVMSWPLKLRRAIRINLPARSIILYDF